jgi:hypothetical protein
LDSNTYIMTTFNPTKDIPSEFYTVKTFFTLSGAAAAVWIFCLVIGAIFPTDSITPLQYRLIAIALSELIAVLMVIRLKTKKIEHWFLALFNGLLIFINASGWNVITTNNFFSDKVKASKVEPSDSKRAPNAALLNNNQTLILAGTQLLRKQIYWWQDNSVFVENRQLKKENKALTEKVIILSKGAIIQTPAIIIDSSSKNPNIKDSLLVEIRKKDNLIKELTTRIALNNAQPQNRQTMTDSLLIIERKRNSDNWKAMEDIHKTKLKKCESEKMELQSKLTTTKILLDNCIGDHP